jgi:hypothetical protein
VTGSNVHSCARYNHTARICPDQSAKFCTFLQRFVALRFARTRWWTFLKGHSQHAPNFSVSYMCITYKSLCTGTYDIFCGIVIVHCGRLLQYFLCNKISELFVNKNVSSSWLPHDKINTQSEQMVQMPGTKYVFPHRTLFPFLWPHCPASWTGSRAGSPVSYYVSLNKTVDTAENQKSVSRARICERLRSPAIDSSA